MEELSPDSPSRKRRKLMSSSKDVATSTTSKRNLDYLHRPVSPPPLRKGKSVDITKDVLALPSVQQQQQLLLTSQGACTTSKVIKSPFQLTQIRDLPDDSNVDAVSIKDLLGDPLISECWNFNYLHNLDFLMESFDPDVKNMVKVHVVHGFWRNEDSSKAHLKAEAEKYKNLTLHTAFMPEMFGTHHTKMLILFRHDETAQVIIHTANIIPFDWENMTQALWKSALLPKTKPSTSITNASSQSPEFGSGARFKTDLLNYLKSYDTKRTICEPLISLLGEHDFSSIRATLIGSVPGKQNLTDSPSTWWGWPALKEALKSLPSLPSLASSKTPEIVIQISSIATMGGTDKWLDQTLFKALEFQGPTPTSKSLGGKRPKFKIIFPTADEIRRSLNGYVSGGAIHTKLQSAAQQKQMAYLKPVLYHWAGDGAQHEATSSSSSEHVRDAGRKRAAPHIKTYVRFSDEKCETIDWMLVTSANLSKQAWGEATNKEGDVRVCSYELGVLVWPGLLGGEDAKMVPTFKTDTPEMVDGEGAVVGARMPYDLPLIQYSKGDEPWCATKSYSEPDWKGQTYMLSQE